MFFSRLYIWRVGPVCITRSVTTSNFSVARFMAKKTAIKQPTTKLSRSGGVKFQFDLNY